MPSCYPFADLHGIRHNQPVGLKQALEGEWQEGLLPVQGVGEQTIAQYRAFSRLVEQAQKASRWSIP